MGQQIFSMKNFYDTIYLGGITLVATNNSNKNQIKKKNHYKEEDQELQGTSQQATIKSNWIWNFN